MTGYTHWRSMTKDKLSVFSSPARQYVLWREPRAFLLCILLVSGLLEREPNQVRIAPAVYLDTGTVQERSTFATNPPPQTGEVCPPPTIVEIREADPQIDLEHHNLMRDQFMEAVRQDHRTILLGPDVLLDFSDAEFPPDPNDPEDPEKTDVALMRVGRCVTILSVNAFEPHPTEPTPTTRLDVAAASAEPPSARTGHSLGPLLNFGPHEGKKTFFLIHCNAGDEEPPDHIRFSGFRIHGPSFGQQEVDNFGIKIYRCLDIEVSNMEIAGWGGAAVQVEDEAEEGPGQEPSTNHEGERIGRPEQIQIFGNYFHHNQNPAEITWDDWDWSCWWIICVPHPFKLHAMGYGVDVHHGAWAIVYENVFDFNRHAIAAAGDTGGYDAERNLVLKGGGYHGLFYNRHTHIFDIHGTGCRWSSNLCGDAGVQLWYVSNAFQYRNGNAIKIRGKPKVSAIIDENVFPHSGLEDDWGDDAIHLNTAENVTIGPHNIIEVDTYGKYGVCDFDGDGIDDLFLPTGNTWWYSSYGEFQWTYLSARTERLDQVRLGYFDEDQICDVLTESGPRWVIASGGTGPWTSIGEFGAPLDEVAFGRFDPNVPDPRPGATKQTTHAFWRTEDGEWLITSLSAPAWEQVQSSSFPMDQLRFGDFTGDGVTDVLAVEDGRWSISKSARESWQQLNPDLDDDVESLYIADLDNNNIDDLIKLDRMWGVRYTWRVSYDGRTSWQELKTYWFPDLLDLSFPVVGFAGRFGAAPGGGLLLIDRDRMGHFFSEAEIPAGASSEWMSLYPY